jgi:hypothetical protein
MDRIGLEWTVREGTGLTLFQAFTRHWIGVERSGAERTGEERIGMDGNGKAIFQAFTSDGTGPERKGRERSGEDRTGWALFQASTLEWIGMDRR